MSRVCELTRVGVMSGNNVSHSERKTRRKFLPNLRKMRLYSDALGVFTSLRITARALSTVEKVGGLDIYLLNTNPDKLSRAALSLRNILITKLSEAL